ncbi:MAG: oxygen-independent coproporphyrinogen III oxidase [Chitinophagales bacterium]|nr:oxygen-independent coproporphyrinogen III oxidase [Chitinophagales bacterium]
MISPSLIAKYNQPVPRYTSYPTVPFWKDSIDVARWKETFRSRFSTHNNKEGISLYIHLPFCEALCTYCGCNKKITTNHSVEEEYIQAIKKEWQMYRALMDSPPVLREIHLGGGTPSFFAPENLAALLQFIFQDSVIHPQHEFSFEGHPNNTTEGHLKTLYTLGFRRVSFGVQDNDPEVQRIINRIQPLQNVKRATDTARAVGYQSVNYDLIYGLPKQTLEGIQKTIREIIELRPDRIAFYSYAHVPWTSKGQRLFDESDLPSAELKLQLYLAGKELLTQAGYVDIGMDHFALTTDDLYIASQNGTLHRNFMGYTTQATEVMLGLGVSSISDTGNAFAQNKKLLSDYYEGIKQNQLPLQRGYFLSEEDEAFRAYILDVSCRGYVTFRQEDLSLLRQFTFPELELLAADGLLTWSENEMTVTATGKHFIRNICRAFDLHLLRNNELEKKNTFSKAI